MWNPYLGIHMLSFARFVFTAALLVWSVSSGQADGGPKDLWSLYLREHSANLCGRGLSEEEETELDEAQHRARLGRACHSPKQRTFIAAREKPHIQPAALSAAAAKSCRASCTTSAPMPSGCKNASSGGDCFAPVRSALVPQMVPRASN